jgi:anti-anti-sigma regulatory factor
MDVETRQLAETCILRLEGSWTIERAHELKSMLVAALADKDQVIIDVEGLMQADLSCLQLLCSAHRASLKVNKRLVLNDKPAEVFKKLVQEAGYERTLGCHRDPGKSCFWNGGWSGE